MLLHLLTGGPVEVQDSGGVFAKEEAPGGPPHVRLDVMSTGWNSTEDLLRIVRAELPATVTFDMWVGSEQVWPRTEVQRSSAAARPSASATISPAGSRSRGDLPPPDAAPSNDPTGETDG